MTDKTKNAIVAKLASRHSLPEDAVSALLDALRRGGGAMAQFNHPALGGMGQWSGGMLIIGDMFNDQLKGKVSALAHDLAVHVRSTPPPAKQDEVSYRSTEPSDDWWPSELGHATSAGSQNNMRYAIFPSKKRLAIKDGDDVSIYDTNHHVISGISQAQSSSSTLSFTSQHGLVKVGELRKVAQ